jgi:hypothetical protein
MNRAELVSWFLGIFVLAVTGIWIGWRNRGRRQSDIAALPVIPADLGTDLVPPISGLYVGTTMSGQWQNRLVVHTLGLRASCIARLTTAGVVIQRKGTRAIFIPADRLIDARLEPTSTSTPDCGPTTSGSTRRGRTPSIPRNCWMTRGRPTKDE